MLGLLVMAGGPSRQHSRDSAPPSSTAAKSPECTLAGQWRSADGDRRSEVHVTGSTWSGRVVWSSGKDIPIGFVMLREFARDEDTGRYKGKLARPGSKDGGDHEVPAQVRCVSADMINVTVARGPLKRTRTWHRVNADLGGGRRRLSGSRATTAD